jgi:copper chaperone NosL
MPDAAFRSTSTAAPVCRPGRDAGTQAWDGQPAATGLLAARVQRGLGPWLAACAVLIPLLTTLVACSNDPGSGPLEPKWDRNACERCRMVLSDRKHSAQVRIPQAEGRSRVLFFDDVGCAATWLEDKPFRDDPRTEIWVKDWQGGTWIDARKAWYIRGQVTPMEYGLGAQVAPAPEALDWAAANEHIRTVEAKYNIHGGHLDAAPPNR